MVGQASLVIRNAGRLTTGQQKKLACWLRRQASDLEKDGAQYANYFSTESQTYTVKGAR